MSEPTFDRHGYPTEATLAAIREWPLEDLVGLFDFIESAWKYHDYFRRHPKGIYRLSTGGWSGNEELIGAFKTNSLAWSVCWLQSTRGGHYQFQIPRSRTPT